MTRATAIYGVDACIGALALDIALAGATGDSASAGVAALACHAALARCTTVDVAGAGSACAGDVAGGSRTTIDAEGTCAQAAGDDARHICWAANDIQTGNAGTGDDAATLDTGAAKAFGLYTVGGLSVIRARRAIHDGGIVGFVRFSKGVKTKAPTSRRKDQTQGPDQPTRNNALPHHRSNIALRA